MSPQHQPRRDEREKADKALGALIGNTARPIPARVIARPPAPSRLMSRGVRNAAPSPSPRTPPMTNDVEQATRLTEFDKAEWRDISRSINPTLTDEEFDRDWSEFCAMKDRKAAQ